MKNEDALTDLNGSWLEFQLFRKLYHDDRLPKATRSSFSMGREFILDLKGGKRSTHVEIDLMLFVNGQLHCIEVKAATTGKGLNEVITKQGSRKSEFLGPHGLLFLYAPFVPANDRSVSGTDFFEKSAKQGVKPLLGSDAYEKLVAELTKL